MARGTKSYFRHHTGAFEDSKIQKAIELLGYEGYAYYFIILELLAKQCENEFKNPIQIHQQTVRIVLRKSSQSCDKVVTKLSQCGLFVVTKLENSYLFDIPNLSKYMGRYESKFALNVPNKSKENKSKVKEKETCEVEQVFDSKKIDIEPIELIPEICRERIDASREELREFFCLGIKNAQKIFEKFPSEFIFEEIYSMKNWLSENPKRKFTYLFVLGWLKRGYDIERHGPSEFVQESVNLNIKKLIEEDNAKRL